jgi:hypothetical protein
MGIDEVLRKPIEAGLIPGVVVLAADDRLRVASRPRKREFAVEVLSPRQ